MTMAFSTDFTSDFRVKCISLLFFIQNVSTPNILLGMFLFHKEVVFSWMDKPSSIFRVKLKLKFCFALLVTTCHTNKKDITFSIVKIAQLLWNAVESTGSVNFRDKHNNIHLYLLIIKILM